MKKKAFMLVLASCIMCCLVACGNQTDKTDNSEITVEETELVSDNADNGTDEEIVETTSDENDNVEVEDNSEDALTDEETEKVYIDTVTWIFPDSVPGGGQTVNNVLEGGVLADKVTTITTNGITADFTWTGPNRLGAVAGTGTVNNGMAASVVLYDDTRNRSITFSIAPQSADFGVIDYEVVSNMTVDDGFYAVTHNNGVQVYGLLPTDNGYASLTELWYDEETASFIYLSYCISHADGENLSETEIAEAMEVLESVTFTIK